MKALNIIALIFSLCSCRSTTAPKPNDEAFIINTAANDYTSENVVKSLEDKVEAKEGVLSISGTMHGEERAFIKVDNWEIVK